MAVNYHTRQRLDAIDARLQRMRDEVHRARVLVRHSARRKAPGVLDAMSKVSQELLALKAQLRKLRKALERDNQQHFKPELRWEVRALHRLLRVRTLGEEPPAGLRRKRVFEEPMAALSQTPEALRLKAKVEKEKRR